MKKIKNICIVTGSRAEYGLLSNLMKKISLDPVYNFQLLVTGSHLSLEYGLTYKDILKDGFKISGKINLKIKTSDKSGVIDQMSLALKGFSKVYKKLNPDLIIILGDRYEIFCSALVATIFKIPILHIHGGEVTLGSIDDTFRHSITKMSTIHFVATKKSAQRVRQLGENKKYIFHVGSLGIENLKKLRLLSKDALNKKFNINLKKSFFLITFHPETLSELSVKDQIRPLLKALENFSYINLLFTGSNSDIGGNIINDCIKQYVKIHENAFFFENLGYLNYLSFMKSAASVIGNSSSGIIEAPALKVRSINIGIRQTGREKSSSIIDCKNNVNDIISSCEYILNPYNKKVISYKSPYEKKNTSNRILDIIKGLDYEKFKIKQFVDYNK